jgi:AP-4 complex subunit beta-1
MSAMGDIGVGGATPAATGYFVDQKKGEVNELKQVRTDINSYDTDCRNLIAHAKPQLLKNINVERDVKRKRDVIKKVIAYMTLGIDVSRLFTDMIMVSKALDYHACSGSDSNVLFFEQAIESKDIVIKKMVYLYLCTYANTQPDLAIMCINSLRREW